MNDAADQLVELVELDACGSTQQELAQLLEGRPRDEVVALAARSQSAGRGRGGRRWEDPPGSGLLVSVGRRGSMPVQLLEDLPRRAVDETLAALAQLAPRAEVELAWKPPNDIVASSGGEKVGGVLVDARTVGGCVEQLLIGIGINLGGAPFRTADGRAASSVAATCGVEPAHHAAASLVATRVARLLSAGLRNG